MDEESFIKLGVEYLTKRQIEIMRLMESGKELVMESGSAFIGYNRTSQRSVIALLRYCAIKSEDGSKVGRFERYRLSGTGREILKRLEGK